MRGTSGTKPRAEAEDDPAQESEQQHARGILDPVATLTFKPPHQPQRPRRAPMMIQWMSGEYACEIVLVCVRLASTVENIFASPVVTGINVPNIRK